MRLVALSILVAALVLAGAAMWASGNIGSEPCNPSSSIYNENRCPE